MFIYVLMGRIYVCLGLCVGDSLLIDYVEAKSVGEVTVCEFTPPEAFQKHIEA